jgi:ankyrin repeat protein
MNSLEKLPYELKLDIFLKMDSFERVKNLCLIKGYTEVCRRDKSRIMAHVFFNKYDEDAFSQEKVLKNSGDLQMVKELVRLGANIRIKNDILLITSAASGHLEVVKYLVQNGADVHAKKDLAFRISAQNGHLDVVKYLVQKGSDIHANNDDALIKAAVNGHLEIIKYLEENGVNIHTNDSVALIGSARNGHLHVVKYLAEKGANIHSRNDKALYLHLFGQDILQKINTIKL